jgi:transcriptional regulator with XRE-family HTH domain
MNGIDVKALRKKLHLSQTKLAELLGVHFRTVQNYEKGGVIPKSKRTILSNLESVYASQSNQKNLETLVAKYRIETEVQMQSILERLDDLQRNLLEKDSRIDRLLEQNSQLISMLLKENKR